MADKLIPAFVPNDVMLSQNSNMQIIQGPNMSGKTTLLKTVALTAIMAHIGCYVPAEVQFSRLHFADAMNLCPAVMYNATY